MVIYHFCNDTFGTPFPAVSAAFAKTRGLRIVRVLAEKPTKSTIASVSKAIRRPAGRALRRAHRVLVGAPSNAEDLPTIYVTDVNSPSFRRRIQKGDAGIITGFNQIFSAATIERFSSFVNLHPSILPLYRGPVPTYWCIRNRERLTGFTLHKVTPKIDVGEALYQEVVAIGDETDVLDLERKIARAALPMFSRYLEHIASGGQWVPQYVDAFAVYETHQNYATFPELESLG